VSDFGRLSLGAGLALVGALVLGLTVLAGSAANSSTTEALSESQACEVSGPVPGLSAQQAADAAMVASVAMANTAESTHAAKIAVMTAYTESHLENLGPQVGNQGSLGLFQQRASQGWGTPAEEQDPAEATAMFVWRLMRVPHWETIAPWLAAQDVQRSAFADGSNYRANWAFSGQIVSGVVANMAAPGGCGQGPPGGLAGPASSHGLPAGYTVPAGTPPAHTEAVMFALHQLGKPYVWAAAGPNAFDCSGLTMAAWATLGVHLDHYTVDQERQGPRVSPLDMTVGDLVLIPGSDPPGPGLPGHVGLYIGDGLVLSAVDPQLGVVVQSWSMFTAGGLDAVVDPGPGD
jgi:cell wall-associated NlpC family hydrolase